MRLIDADKSIDILETIPLYSFDKNGKLVIGSPNEDKAFIRYTDVQNAINKQSTVDSVPVVHGHWIRQDIDQGDECSNCHAWTDRSLMCCNGSPSTRYEQHPFCQWCGAKMTGDFIYDLETGEQIKDGEHGDD